MKVFWSRLLIDLEVSISGRVNRVAFGKDRAQYWTERAEQEKQRRNNQNSVKYS